MRLQGERPFGVARETLFRALEDPQVLGRTLPGVKELVAEGQGRYRTVLELALGPFKGQFRGQVEVRERCPPESLALRLSVESPVGRAEGEGRLFLEEAEGATRMRYEGEARLMGGLAALGGRLLLGAAQGLLDQFFRNLEAELGRRYGAGTG